MPEDELVAALVVWAEFINQPATAAAIARAEQRLAARAAQRDRSVLLAAKGDDANHAGERIVEIRKTVNQG